MNGLWAHDLLGWVVAYLDLVAVLDSRLGLLDNDVKIACSLRSAGPRLVVEGTSLTRAHATGVMRPGRPLQVVLEVEFNKVPDIRQRSASRIKIWTVYIVDVAPSINVVYFDIVRVKNIAFRNTEGAPGVQAPIDKGHVIGLDVKATVNGVDRIRNWLGSRKQATKDVSAIRLIEIRLLPNVSPAVEGLSRADCALEVTKLRFIFGVCDSETVCEMLGLVIFLSSLHDLPHCNTGTP